MPDRLVTRRALFPLTAIALCSSLALLTAAQAQTPAPAPAPPAAQSQQAAPIERQPPSDSPMQPRPMRRPPMRPGMMRGQGNFRGNSMMHYDQNGPQDGRRGNFGSSAMMHRGPGGFHGGPGGGFHGPEHGDMGPGMGAGFHIAPPGIWWKNPMIVQRLTLTPDQVTRMDAIFQKSRIDLIDLKANVEKQEVLLEPMLSANPPDTAKASLQIDKVADARASLEKSNAKMLLGIRGVLTPDQWTKLSARGRFAGPGATAAPAPADSGTAPASPPRRQRGPRPPAPTQTTPPPS